MKTYIKNRDGNKICVVVEAPEKPANLAFVMHGLGGNKTGPHIRAMAGAFMEHSYTVVTWDAVHTFGESDGGSYEDATVTNYYADLEDVIDWARSQSWFVQPFVLAGHSLGGISTALYAERHPEEVMALAPLSAVISGKLSLETKDAGDLEAWKRNGIRTTRSHDGKLEKRLKWSHMEDRCKYDLLPDAEKLTMPVILIVGGSDQTTPAEHQRLLYEKLPGKKEIHVINDALHSFYETHEQQELKQLLKTWIASL